MEELFDPESTDFPSPYLVSEVEASTVALAIGSFLLDAQSHEIADDKNKLKYLESHSIAQDTLDLIEKGQRIISNEADLYLVAISTQWFISLFDRSIGRDGYIATAASLGITADEFIDHAITASRILAQVPEHIRPPLFS